MRSIVNSFCVWPSTLSSLLIYRAVLAAYNKSFCDEEQPFAERVSLLPLRTYLPLKAGYPTCATDKLASVH